jgi:hypothetical protein
MICLCIVLRNERLSGGGADVAAWERGAEYRHTWAMDGAVMARYV